MNLSAATRTKHLGREVVGHTVCSPQQSVSAHDLVETSGAVLTAGDHRTYKEENSCVADFPDGFNFIDRS